MPLQRSPGKPFSSDSDLSNSAQSGNVTLRKRKHDEDIFVAFEDFTKKIMETLNGWKADLQNDISQINSTVESVWKADLEKLNGSIAEIKDEINNARQEYQELKNSVQSLDCKHKETLTKVMELEKSVKFHSDKYDEFNEKMDLLPRAQGQIELLENKVSELASENNQLKSEFNLNNQRDRLLNLEITGVDETKDENLLDIFISIAKHAKVIITSEDVMEINRVSPKIKQPGRPKNIVVKLKSRLIKDNIISGIRKNKLTANDLGFLKHNQPIYANEHLTQYNKFLLKKVRDTAKKREYQYVWTRHGRIYVRKNDTSPALQMTQDADILKIV